MAVFRQAQLPPADPMVLLAEGLSLPKPAFLIEDINIQTGAPLQRHEYVPSDRNDIPNKVDGSRP
jgi:hypothetical protein